MLINNQKFNNNSSTFAILSITVISTGKFLQLWNRRGRVDEVALFGGSLVMGGRCMRKRSRADWLAVTRAGRRVPQHRGYSKSKVQGKSGVGILVDRELRESVVEDRRVNNRLIAIKAVVGGSTLNVISAYALQAGLDEEVKRHFWEGSDEVVRNIPPTEKLFIGGDFNGHIGSSAGGYGEVHGGFGFGNRNERGTSLLDFARAFALVIAISSFPKREEHLITFRSMVATTQIDYHLLKRYLDKEDEEVCMGSTRIRWGVLTKDNVQELEGRLTAMGAWKSGGDASAMWMKTTDCIREAAREELGISKVYSGGHRDDWWWYDEA
ncbi:PREDICTED: uncharacterized protein LOC109224268 [Nicotiana attenuata]|uniref:uncharacterized protein LOC109224268 n=1 Tax=Nicotiana attenuata TaxID=49451 RepID=UPI0009052137|nr:PREDICTED: uncharacterized protein LOC109224268 [Nicotiana attenuata]